MEKIIIQNQIISVNMSVKSGDYISLTDIAKYKNKDEPKDVIKNWMRNKSTLEFLRIWERLNNPNSKGVEFDPFRNEVGSNSFTMSPEKWIKTMKAIGIKSSSGRFGGTFAHKDIAFEFASWISSEFKLYLIREFQRLKEDESKLKNLDWNIKRSLTKVNYKIHTGSIKENIIIPNKIKNPTVIYANEADVLNMALFGVTAKNWKLNNEELEGNMRDYADVTQLICLSNLEVLNSEFIAMGMDQSERLIRLNEIAISQMTLLVSNSNVKKLK